MKTEQHLLTVLTTHSHKDVRKACEEDTLTVCGSVFDA